jgi:quercetin dioxygenase-like cupin family protein
MTGEFVLPADSTEGWSPSPKVDGLEEKLLWQAAPGFASIALLRFAAGAGIKSSHSHASNQFMYCLEGEYAYETDGTTLSPGSFYWNPAGNEHGPTTALTDTLLLEIYDGRHYAEPEDDLLIPEHRIGTHLLHTNALVNIWDVSLQPGEIIPWHRHRYPYVVVTVDGSKTAITDKATGDVRNGAGGAGDVVYDPGGAHHSLKNVGDSLLRDRLMEFKIPTSKLLPPRATGK